MVLKAEVNGGVENLIAGVNPEDAIVDINVEAAIDNPPPQKLALPNLVAVFTLANHKDGSSQIDLIFEQGADVSGIKEGLCAAFVAADGYEVMDYSFKRLDSIYTFGLPRRDVYPQNYKYFSCVSVFYQDNDSFLSNSMCPEMLNKLELPKNVVYHHCKTNNGRKFINIPELK